MEPIKIDDNISARLYCDIALLVDNPRFLKGLERLRNKWGIKKLVPTDKFIDWREKIYRRSSSQESQSESEVEDMEEFEDKTARLTPHIDLECDVRDLRIECKRTDNFDKVIMYALVCGMVPDGVYKTAYSEATGAFTRWKLRGNSERVAIFITPQTTEDDLKAEWKSAKKYFFKPKHDYLMAIGIYKTGKEEVKTHRSWYLSWLKEKNIKKIADEDQKKTGGTTFTETVRKGIDRYREAIGS